MKHTAVVVTTVCSLLLYNSPPSYAATKSTPKAKPTSSTVASKSPDRQIDPANFESTRVARLIFDKTNDERRKAGLVQFQWGDGLASAATGHSQDMADKNYFSHDGKGWLNKSHMTDRARGAGVQANALAENIAMLPTFRSQRTNTFYDGKGNSTQRLEVDGNSYDQLATWALEQWMNSPGHRQNILNPALNRLGVGVALGDHGGVPYAYLTQDFAGE